MFVYDRSRPIHVPDTTVILTSSCYNEAVICIPMVHSEHGCTEHGCFSTPMFGQSLTESRLAVAKRSLISPKGCGSAAARRGLRGAPRDGTLAAGPPPRLHLRLRCCLDPRQVRHANLRRGRPELLVLLRQHGFQVRARLPRQRDRRELARPHLT